MGHRLRKARIEVFLITLLLCFISQIADAQRVALLPLADVSHGTKGIGGINLPVTQELKKALQRQGFELVQDDDVERFLIKNRIRTSGYLDSFLAYKLGKELDCSLVFVGTVTEYSETEGGALGLTLSAFDTMSGMQVWGGTRGMDAEEFVSVLGLGESKDLNSLTDLTLDSLLHGVEESINVSGLLTLTTPYKILDLQMSPKFINGGEPISLQLEMNFLDKVPTRIALKSGPNEFPLAPGPSPGIYQGTVISEMASGPHQVSLVFEWEDEKGPEFTANLASYVVVNSPPPLELVLHKGVDVAGVTLFRSHLVIIPDLAKQPLMDRWMMELRDERDVRVMAEEHMGNLPGRLVWYGKNKHGRQIKDGLYTFSLKAWDSAGNEIGRDFPVALQTEPASLDFQVFFENGKKFLKVQSVGAIVAPVIDWKLNATNLKGSKILQVSGDTLPLIIEIPDTIKDGPLICDLDTMDSLGNRLLLKGTEVELPKNTFDANDPAFASSEDAGWVDSF